MNICLYLLGKVYYMRRNKAKTEKWEGLTDQVSSPVLIYNTAADGSRKRSSTSRRQTTQVTSFLTLNLFIRDQRCISFASTLEIGDKRSVFRRAEANPVCVFCTAPPVCIHSTSLGAPQWRVFMGSLALVRWVMRLEERCMPSCEVE